MTSNYTDAKVLLFSVARPPEPATMVEMDAMLDDPVEQSVHRAGADHVDLIVLGRRGKSRFEKMLVGSTAEKVLRYAHCPVMVVK